eukprot:CAMPEP_0196587626 /NCGR_PEP_ID=MMETSP1081-20130531/58088_1 /TAXON_ID=36882 /ORGANISM="Pyramimonas amylifera, Strain CCMP720" /LENGTH=994 /DNA_ID=CAMNT_0041909865 /DNA_START=322 /DNA_END=3306 /DNA_ORIENTATION=-
MVEELSLPESDRLDVQHEMEIEVSNWRSIGWGCEPIENQELTSEKLEELDPTILSRLFRSSSSDRLGNVGFEQFKCERNCSMEKQCSISATKEDRPPMTDPTSSSVESLSPKAKSCIPPLSAMSVPTASILFVADNSKKHDPLASCSSCGNNSVSDAGNQADSEEMFFVADTNNPISVVQSNSLVQIVTEGSLSESSGPDFTCPDFSSPENSLPRPLIMSNVSGLFKVDQWLEATVMLPSPEEHFEVTKALLEQLPSSETTVRARRPSEDRRKSSISSYSACSCPDLRRLKDRSLRVSFESKSMRCFIPSAATFNEDDEDVEEEEKWLEEKQMKEQEELKRRHDLEKEMIRQKKSMKEARACEARSRNSSMKSYLSSEDRCLNLEEKNLCHARSPFSDSTSIDDEGKNISAPIFIGEPASSSIDAHTTPKPDIISEQMIKSCPSEMNSSLLSAHCLPPQSSMIRSKSIEEFPAATEKEELFRPEEPTCHQPMIFVQSMKGNFATSSEQDHSHEEKELAPIDVCHEIAAASAKSLDVCLSELLDHDGNSQELTKVPDAIIVDSSHEEVSRRHSSAELSKLKMQVVDAQRRAQLVSEKLQNHVDKELKALQGIRNQTNVMTSKSSISKEDQVVFNQSNPPHLKVVSATLVDTTLKSNLFSLGSSATASSMTLSKSVTEPSVPSDLLTNLSAEFKNTSSFRNPDAGSSHLDEHVHNKQAVPKIVPNNLQNIPEIAVSPGRITRTGSMADQLSLAIKTEGSSATVIGLRNEELPPRRHSYAAMEAQKKALASEKLQSHVEKELKALEGVFGERKVLSLMPQLSGVSPVTRVEQASRTSSSFVSGRPPIPTTTVDNAPKAVGDGLAASTMKMLSSEKLDSSHPLAKTPDEIASEKGEKLKRAEEQRKVLEMKALSELNNKGSLASISLSGSKGKGLGPALQEIRDSSSLYKHISSGDNSMARLSQNSTHERRNGTNLADISKKTSSLMELSITGQNCSK